MILPTYEERDTIDWVLARLLALPEHVDILVVDDSSPDGTGDLVRAVAADEPRVRLLERPAKSGLGSAYLEGFRTGLAEGYDLVRRDGLGPLARPRGAAGPARGRGNRHDLTSGAATCPGGSVTDWSRSRVALSRAGNTYARFMLGAAHPRRDERVPRLPTWRSSKRS